MTKLNLPNLWHNLNWQRQYHFFPYIRGINFLKLDILKVAQQYRDFSAWLSFYSKIENRKKRNDLKSLLNHCELCTPLCQCDCTRCGTAHWADPGPAAIVVLPVSPLQHCTSCTVGICPALGCCCTGAMWADRIVCWQVHMLQCCSAAGPVLATLQHPASHFYFKPKLLKLLFHCTTHNIFWINYFAACSIHSAARAL